MALLLPAVSHADNSNSYTDPFSPFNPNSFAAQNRDRQQLALVKQRQTWWDRFRQRLDSTWKEPPGSRFFARLFRRDAAAANAGAASKRWGAEIFTRFRRDPRVAFNTTTTGIGQARVADKVSRTALFDNTGSFGKEVQRAVADTRVGYWDARGGKLMARVARRVKQLLQQGTHRAKRWYGAGAAVERRPDHSAAIEASRRWKVQQHKSQQELRRYQDQQRRMIPAWRVQKR